MHWCRVGVEIGRNMADSIHSSHVQLSTTLNHIWHDGKHLIRLVTNEFKKKTKVKIPCLSQIAFTLLYISCKLPAELAFSINTAEDSCASELPMLQPRTLKRPPARSTSSKHWLMTNLSKRWPNRNIRV